ncbi:MAG: YggS family pyridoxal phosphate-dependent enzyme, partial [Candidatus Omnitrophica bacterium]|nr:YggS family pyridoxal phosphate-dependent enzyme [Candidatus Omnitrophota bacterium]
EAVGIFDLIHSVDSYRLATEIDRQAAKIDKIQDILLEVKTSPEISKSGVLPQEAGKLIGDILRLRNIALKGLMTIAPIVTAAEEARPYFRTIKELRGKFKGLEIFSMGMTDDFEVAIEEGSNLVRIGRAIFEGKA